MKSPNDIEDVVIIGAGLSGLTAAYEFKRRGVHARVLEREQNVGGAWRNRHPQLSLNTHRTVSHMPGLKYPAGTAAFPRKDAVANHLEEFARINGLKVEHGISVTNIVIERNLFLVATNAGEVVARNVVIAVGRDHKPREPSIPGREHFNGEILHAAVFGTARRYIGKRVLVIGGGNSGFDVLNHLTRVAIAESWLSVRTGSAVLPKRLGGIAVHRLSPIIARLPTSVADIAITLTQRAAFGDLKRLGFPQTQRGAATRLRREQVAIAIDDGAIRAIEDGRVTVLGEVKEFVRSGRVLLMSGAEIEPDVVIYATGYSPGLRPIVGGLGVLDEQGFPLRHRADHMSDRSGLWFVGMTPGLVSYFHNTRREAIAIAHAISTE